ncbi:hypothetical protein BDW22DRAFT_1427970 [Trametopsis cervina]|nr:hypothetical protein BDW22DRAFT_1427970 [Trametopsis cervina]
MAPVGDNKSSALSRRVRRMLLLKPKESSPAPPIISLPSRLPISNKRTYGEVDASDVSDLPHISSTTISRGARVRQRTDSTSSVATIQPTPRPHELRKSDSTESICTIVSTKKHKRAPSTLPLNPGPTRPARAVLTRTAYTCVQSNEPHVVMSQESENKDIVPFPTLDTSASDRDLPQLPKTITQPTGSGVAKKPKPLTRESSSMMSIVWTGKGTSVSTHTRTSNTQEPTKSPRPLTRSSSSMMSILSDHESSRPPSRIPVSSIMSRTRRSSLLAKDEERDAQAALDRALEDELEADDVGSDFREMLASVSRKPSADSSRKTQHSLDSQHAKSFAEACEDDTSLRKGWNRGRFDIQVLPREKHLTVWDAQDSAITTWHGTLAVVDTSLPADLTAPPYDFPPIDELELVFSSLEDVTLPLTPPSSPSTSSVSPPVRTPKPDFSVPYTGKTLDPQRKAGAIRLSEGIVLEPSWQWGPLPDVFLTDGVSSTSAAARMAYLIWFYVPIPMSLFERREYRRFRISSRAVFNAPGTNLSSFDVHPDLVDVAVEHLRKELHMDGRKPLAALRTPPPSPP